MARWFVIGCFETIRNNTALKPVHRCRIFDDGFETIRNNTALKHISKPTLYDYCDKNPDFRERKELLKQRVKTRAKLNISKAIDDGDIDLSKWYLERRDNDFKTKQAVTHDGEVNINQTNPFADLTTDDLRKLIDDG